MPILRSTIVKAALGRGIDPIELIASSEAGDVVQIYGHAAFRCEEPFLFSAIKLSMIFDVLFELFCLNYFQMLLDTYPSPSIPPTIRTQMGRTLPQTYIRPVVMHYFWLNTPGRAELADFFACLKSKKKKQRPLKREAFPASHTEQTVQRRTYIIVSNYKQRAQRSKGGGECHVMFSFASCSGTFSCPLS